MRPMMVGTAAALVGHVAEKGRRRAVVLMPLDLEGRGVGRCRRLGAAAGGSGRWPWRRTGAAGSVEARWRWQAARAAWTCTYCRRRMMAGALVGFWTMEMPGLAVEHGTDLRAGAAAGVDVVGCWSAVADDGRSAVEDDGDAVGGKALVAHRREWAGATL
ncbi:hypothetical protein ACLOJK_029960 [Asimina triloba]